MVRISIRRVVTVHDDTGKLVDGHPVRRRALSLRRRGRLRRRKRARSSRDAEGFAALRRGP